MPKEPKHSYKNPAPEFLEAVEQNRAAKEREMRVKREIRGLEAQAIVKLKKSPLNKHNRHGSELVIKEGRKIVPKYILTVSQDGHDFRIQSLGGAPVMSYDERLRVLNAFLEQNPG